MKGLIILFLIGVWSCQPKDISENHIPKIGTKYFIWHDTERIDEYYGGTRMINVQIWYPTDIRDSNKTFPPAPYYYQIDKIHKNLDHWTDEDYQFVSEIQTNSVIGPPVKSAKSKYPVILLSPSLGGNMSQYTYYAEYLTKSGFVVVGVNHLHESEYVIGHEMNVFPSNLAFHDSLKQLEIPSQITAEKYREVKGVRHRVLGEDLIFCLNKLEEINESEFEGLLDLENVGAFGHSIGGAAVIYASFLDQRFDAILDIDGTPPTVALKQGINAPFMFIEDLTDYNNHVGYKKMHQRRSSFCEINAADSYRILIGETSHNSFLDINYHSAQSEAEKKKVLALLQKTANYMNQFFSHYLRGAKLDITEIQTDSLEVIKYEKGKK